MPCRLTAAAQLLLILVLVVGSREICQAQSLDEPRMSRPADDDDANVLDAQQWERVDNAIERALKWLAKSQQRDGSFATLPQGQPGVTSLSVLAFLSVGHTLDGGEYAKELRSALEFALDCQQVNGLIAKARTSPTTVRNNGSHTAYYNHGITGLMFCEAYGMTEKLQSARIERAIPPAIALLQKSQQDKRREQDRGGWQYFTHHHDVDSDMSATAWQLMFLRSAKNAGFDVPEKMVSDAMAYVERCYDEKQGAFRYGLFGRESYTTVGSVGGGIISLSMASKHNTPMARRAGDWLLRQRFDSYNSYIDPGGNYHYGLYYTSQASYHLRGDYWKRVYPRIVKALLDNQRQDGSWSAEIGIASGYGSTYSTALAVLSLTPPYQLLPIYQR